MSEATLVIDGLSAWYGKSQVLRSVSLSVGRGEIVALLGRNGAGKTTLLRSIMGLVHELSGDVRFDGQSLMKAPTHERAKSLAYVPEDRGVFGTITVAENLRIAARPGGRWDEARIYAAFPELVQRSRQFAARLSGGEQQMLSIGRALSTGPSIILLDEPSEGLAPVIVQRLVQVMQAIKADGIGVLLVDHNIDLCRAVAERFCIIDGGTAVWEGTPAQLDASSDVIARHLSLEQV